LKPLELIYRAVNRARRALYRYGILKSKKLPKPVISIGNRAIGGAGKTPAVIAIGRFLIERGYRVAVLTRGYGREGSEEGEMTSLDAAKYGDEPMLIKKALETIDVFVGRKRYENGLRAKCDVYLLDDGFQHLQLHRDVDVVIETPDARWYREGRSALRDAGIVIQRNLRLAVPPEVRGAKLFAFSGLANNEQFFDALRNEGLDVRGMRGFADHHRYSEGDIESIRAAARHHGATTIVTTEKDAVKIPARDIIPIPAEMVIAEEVLQKIIETLSGVANTN
jgi:tetraacyldisaccharide 4'-kinase